MFTIFTVGIVLGMLVKFFLGGLEKAILHVKFIREQNKKFNELQKKVDEMKASGDMHQWMTMVIMGQEVMVCEKTGWAPSLNGFLPMHMIEAYKKESNAAKEYEQFRNARIQLIASENQMTIPQVERLVEQVFSIKKDFTLQRIEKLQKEMEDKASAVLNGQQSN